MDCEEVRNHLIRYMLGFGPSEARSSDETWQAYKSFVGEVEAHLGSCPQCRTLVDDARAKTTVDDPSAIRLSHTVLLEAMKKGAAGLRLEHAGLRPDHTAGGGVVYLLFADDKEEKLIELPAFASNLVLARFRHMAEVDQAADSATGTIPVRLVEQGRLFDVRASFSREPNRETATLRFTEQSAV